MKTALMLEPKADTQTASAAVIWSMPRNRTSMFLIKQLQVAERLADVLNQKLEKAMATLQNFKDLVTGINTETDRLAAKIDELLAKLQAGGMTDAEEAEALAGLQAVSDRLKTIGQDESEPIPPVA